ncbi:unnamed protein product [Adineta steineri]|uniref:Uncharacterized protein n=1 Tax=Adineta steineri TaxID=433720 RepID=A0A814BKF1_9BILA|nr:unnamed protein product [Adineta steineri]
MVPHYSKYQIRLSKNSTKLKCQENLRLRLFIDIGFFLDKLVENHSDDVLSIQKALGFYRLISSYYGIYEHGIYDWSKDFNSREKLSKNRLCGEGQNLRFLIIQKMALKIKELETTYYGPLNEINKEIIFKLFELSINRYSAVRRNAQNDLFYLFNRIPFSYQVIVDRIVELLKSTSEHDHDQVKGCLYLLLGNNNFFLPTKYSWIIKEKLWPLIAHMTHAKKTSTQKLIENIHKKICKNSTTDIIIQNTNEKSICAAKTLWRSLEANEMQQIEEYNQNNIQSYNRLMETLSLLLKDSSLTWKEQEITLSLLCDIRQNRVPMPLSCIETFLDCLIHDHIEIRKVSIKAVISLCRLQKPPHIYVEKSLEEILSYNGKPLPHITTDQCHPGDREDNLWLTFNDYKPPETQIEWEETCFLDKSFHGYYTWPKIIKYAMNKRARYTKDHEMPEDVTILYDRFMNKQFVRQTTQLMILNDNEEQKNFDKDQFVMFKGLFRNFGLAFFDNFMEQLNELIHEKITKKQEGSHRIEREVCLSTSKFEDFINEFLNRIFHIIEISSAEISDAVTTDANDNKPDIDIQPKVTSILFNIVQQCSNPIFQKIRVKIINFLSSQCLSPKVRDIASGLVRALVKGNPMETLKYLLPEICKSIENKCNNFESTLLTDYKDDIELTWYLVVFAELLRARGDVLLIYKQLIMSVFHQYIQIVNKNSYNAVAKAVINLLESLSCSYSVDYRLLVINSDESFDNFLPIRLWGQYVDIDKVQPQFHIPSNDEIDFVYEFVETFLYPELARLNEKGLKMSNNERLRSLTIIRSIAVGVFCFVPPIESKEVQNLMIQSMVPHYSKYQIRLSKKSTELNKLVENHSDDVLSIQKALGLYRLISSYYGIYEHGIYDWSKDFNSREKLSKNKLCGEGQNLRFLIIQKMALKIKELETTYYGPLNEINKEIIFKLFELSINRYSAVRRNAQNDLFYLFNRIPFSYQVIVDRIVELLKSTSEHDHDQVKGCLYLLLCNNNFFLPTKYSWTIKEKLWPLIAHMNHTKKTSTQKLIEDIYKKICKQFATDIIIQNTNEKSICAAKTLWRALEVYEMQQIEEYNQNNIQSYNRLMETLSLLLKDSSLTWKEQKITLSLLCNLRQNRVPMPLSCVETFLDCLIHDHIEIRRLAIIGIISICRLQKPPHIYVEKSLEEILSNNGKPLPHITTDQCHPGDREDNLWLTFNDYKPPETQIEWEETCFLDKPFHGYYTWPKIIKYPMNKRARYTKDHEMPKDVTILYDRFMNKQFVRQTTQLMILNDNEEQKNFDKDQFVMFKLYRLISSDYGIYKHGVYDLSKDFGSQKKLLKNKLWGERQNLRFLIIREMASKIKELETKGNYGSLNEINKEIIFKLSELSINRYSEVRRKAQEDLFCLFNRIHFSYQVIVDRIVELLNSTTEHDHDQIKGCLYLLLGDDSFFLPTKYSWTIKEKLWPLIAHMNHTKKTSTQKLIEDIYKKICKQFATDIIIQNTNEKSICAAKTLWRSLEANEMQKIEEYNQNNIQSYNRLMETLSLLLKDSSLTWKEQEITLSLLCNLRQNRVPMPLSCIETFLDCLIHDHIEIRKLAIKAIVSLCRLQKPPRIYVEKSLEEILSNNGKPLPPITTDQCHPGDREDNLWLTFNDYKPPETQIEWEETCFLDKSFHGYYTWPKIIKYPINKRARYTKDHEMPKDVTILYDRFMNKQFVRQTTNSFRFLFIKLQKQQFVDIVTYEIAHSYKFNFN